MYVSCDLNAARLPDHGTTQFFTGKVEAVDLTSHQYLVAFDRPGIGQYDSPYYICVR